MQQKCLRVYGCVHAWSRRQVGKISCLIRTEIGRDQVGGVQVWGAMLFVEQCEQWAREGGAMGHVMGSMLKLVLDEHRHIHPRPAHKRALSGELPGPASKGVCSTSLEL